MKGWNFGVGFVVLIVFVCNGFGVGDRRDQNTLEKLQGEMLGKIDELKERTNYFTTLDILRVRFYYDTSLFEWFACACGSALL